MGPQLVTLAELDTLIDATPNAAMILLEDADLSGAMSARQMHRRGDEGREQVVDRGLPVWVVSPGPSRVLTSDQVRAEGLDGL